MSDWQPIKTAPKDGTTIFVGTKDWIAVSNHFDVGEQRWWTWYPPIFGERIQRRGRAEAPTHWMPLPSPPPEATPDR